MAMKYFLYSDLQIAEKNTILAKTSKEFVPGIVTMNGKRLRFTQLSDTPKMERFIDTKIVASGDSNEMTYIMPSTTIRSKK